MPLSQRKLEGELRKTLNTPQDTHLKAADLWAQAYAKYAKDAVSCSGLGPLPPNVAKAQNLLKFALTNAFRSSKEVSGWVTRVSKALALFWTAPPMVFAGAPPGVVTVTTGALQTVFAASLLPVMLKNYAEVVRGRSPGTQQTATDLARAIHTVTASSVAVVHGTPLSCSGPIS